MIGGDGTPYSDEAGSEVQRVNGMTLEQVLAYIETLEGLPLVMSMDGEREIRAEAIRQTYRRFEER